MRTTRENPSFQMYHWNAWDLERVITYQSSHPCNQQRWRAKPGGLIPDSMHFPQPTSQHGSQLMFLSSLLSTAPFLSLPLKIRKQFCSYLVLDSHWEPTKEKGFSCVFLLKPKEIFSVIRVVKLNLAFFPFQTKLARWATIIQLNIHPGEFVSLSAFRSVGL